MAGYVINAGDMQLKHVDPIINIVMVGTLSIEHLEKTFKFLVRD